MPVHRFSALQRALRDEWFGLVETADRWTEKGPIGEGESASIRVQNEFNAMVGVAKPGPPKAAETDHCRAAHEKLAFDLAYAAELPVGAVVLWDEAMTAQYRRGRSISSWAFPEAIKWSEADRSRLITPASKIGAGYVISMMRVFHTWIGDTDRKGDHILLDINGPDGDPRVAFIDHGHSMSLTWKTPNAASGPCPNYLPDVPEVRDAMIEAADRIAAIENAEVERLVNRIPAAYLPDPHRGHILQNLMARKGTLRTILGF
jgi:hypothetical protein